MFVPVFPPLLSAPFVLGEIYGSGRCSTRLGYAPNPLTHGGTHGCVTFNLPRLVLRGLSGDCSWRNLHLSGCFAVRSRRVVLQALERSNFQLEQSTYSSRQPLKLIICFLCNAFWLIVACYLFISLEGSIISIWPPQSTTTRISGASCAV
jgi:hypothetical protein